MKKRILVFVISSIIMNVLGAVFYVTYGEIEIWKSVLLYYIFLIPYMVIIYLILKWVDNILKIENRIIKRLIWGIFYLILFSNVIAGYFVTLGPSVLNK